MSYPRKHVIPIQIVLLGSWIYPEVSSLRIDRRSENANIVQKSEIVFTRSLQK